MEPYDTTLDCLNEELLKEKADIKRMFDYMIEMKAKIDTGVYTYEESLFSGFECCCSIMNIYRDFWNYYNSAEGGEKYNRYFKEIMENQYNRI